MDVKAVDSRTNFNGYVDKSVVKLLDRAVKNETEYFLRTANKAGQIIDTSEIKKTQELRNTILEKLTEIMSKFHKDTVFTAHKSYNDSIEFKIVNKYLKHKLEFSDFSLKNMADYKVGNTYIPSQKYSAVVRPAKINMTILESLSYFVDELKNLDYKKVDKTFLVLTKSKIKSTAEEKMTIPGYIKILWQSHKAKKYAGEIGKSYDFKETQKLIAAGKAERKAERLKIKSEKQQQKNIEKQNAKIVSELLNNKS